MRDEQTPKDVCGEATSPLAFSIFRFSCFFCTSLLPKKTETEQLWREETHTRELSNYDDDDLHVHLAF